MSLALGALTGVGAGAFREMRDRGFRTRQQVRQELDLRVLAMLPQLPSVAARASHMDPMFRHSIENPLSLFTEGLRFVKSSADRALKYQRPKVIGVISMLPNEGKTTVSKNLASLLANEGDGCLLIDADTRLQKLTLGLKDDTVNLIDVPERKGSNYLLKKELNSNLLILLQERDGRGAEKEFDFAIAEPLMRQSGQSFEYAVVDFPPLGPVVGARNTANWIDAFVLVIEWGVTSRNALRMLIDNEPEMKRKLLGVILNKTNMDDLKNYVDPDSEDYYHSTYNRYLSGDVRPAA
jgi:succinoglycan biosynthesis transport protein ExoP